MASTHNKCSYIHRLQPSITTRDDNNSICSQCTKAANWMGSKVQFDYLSVTHAAFDRLGKYCAFYINWYVFVLPNFEMYDIFTIIGMV